MRAGVCPPHSAARFGETGLYGFARNEGSDRMKIVFRLLSLLIVVATSSLAPAHAQSVADFYKGKTITILVGSDVGGGYDLHARLLARFMGKHIPGQPSIIVQNKPGASSLMAANYAYEVAPKDGTVIAAVQRPVPYQPLFNDVGARFDVRQIQWLGSTANELGVVVAWHTARQHTIDDLFKEEMVVGGTGPSTDPELYARALNNTVGTKFRIVSGYRGQAQMALAMERGEVEGTANWSWSDIISGHPDWLKDKKIRILLQIGMKKSPDLPDVPLMMDLARTDEQRQVFEILAGMKPMGRPYFVVPGVPADRRDALRTAFTETMQDPEYRNEAQKMFGAVDPTSGTDIQNLVERLYTLPKSALDKARESLSVPAK
jgi:tripartite-type tricarboxylate transporter receptor subunit TctC